MLLGRNHGAAIGAIAKVEAWADFAHRAALLAGFLGHTCARLARLLRLERGLDRELRQPQLEAVVVHRRDRRDEVALLDVLGPLLRQRPVLGAALLA